MQPSNPHMPVRPAAPSPSSPPSASNGLLIAVVLGSLLVVIASVLVVYLVFILPTSSTPPNPNRDLANRKLPNRFGGDFMEEQRRDRARIDIRTLEMALDAYEARQGVLPADWTPLLQPEEGQRAALDVKSLVDPWNQPYQFDPNQRHPTTGRPKVFTRTLQGTIISNW
jgi:hypothetical protein